MSLRLGDTAPDFTAHTTEGELSFHDWLGDSWGLFFSHPADFTPVCTTELGRTASLSAQFKRRGVKVIALSVDPLGKHHDWLADIEETQGSAVDFPIISDEDRKVSELYDMIHPGVSEKATVRSVFIVGPDKKIKLTLTYPPSTGRNFQEIIRVIDSLQLTAHHSLATPADWEAGDDCIISPSVSDEQAAERFPGYVTVKPYLRTTKAPA